MGNPMSPASPAHGPYSLSPREAWGSLYMGYMAHGPRALFEAPEIGLFPHSYNEAPDGHTRDLGPWSPYK